jgi:hypothetical protein
MGVLASLLPSASELVGAFFRTLEHWVADGTTWVLGETWRALSATTEPVLTGNAFDSEYHVMALIGVGTVLPLLGLAVIQAIAHQDVSALLRTALLRLPMALLLTGVVIEIVSLGLTVTDRASASLLATGGAPAASMFLHLEAALAVMGDSQAAAFGGLLLVAVIAVISFVLWIELAVRSAAVAVAALFLPLALAGLVWPATSHWARRLGETLASLVLMKLVMAAVLALAAGALAAGSGGIASVVEGLSLLGLTAFSPYALFRLVPMVEAGAVSHLEGVKPASMVKSYTWSMATSPLLSSGGSAANASAAGSGSGMTPPSAAPTSVFGAGSSAPAAGAAGSGDGRRESGGTAATAGESGVTPSTAGQSGVTPGTAGGSGRASPTSIEDRWTQHIVGHDAGGGDAGN